MTITPTRPSAESPHPDELTLLLIADGEAAPPDAAAHVARCDACGARVAALRTEAASLCAALALAPEEVEFLLAAALPRRLATRASVAAGGWRSVAGLLWIFLPMAVAYAGWLAVLPVIDGWLDLARRSGVTVVLTSAATSLALRAADAYASLVEAASLVPGFSAPLLSLSLLAALTWLALSLSSRRALATEAA